MSDAFNDKAARAMRSAYEAQKKGALIGESGKAKRLVFFEGGELVGAKSNLVEERLGTVLVTEQRITQAELDHATTFIRSGRKLGQILVELGYLKGGEIERFVRIQIMQIASAILTTASDRLVFSEQVPVEAVTLSPVSIGDVFLHATKRLSEFGLQQESRLIGDYVLEQTSDALAIASGMDLSTEQATVVDTVDGDNSVREILLSSPLGEEETIRILVALLHAGVLSLKDRKASVPPEPGPRPAPRDEIADPFEKELIRLYNEIQCQNHWQVLGLERGAAYGEIDRAYRELFNKFDPEQWAHIPDSDFQEKLSFVRARMKEAYITLSSQSSQNVYEELDEKEGEYQQTRQSWDVIEPESAEGGDWQRPKDPNEAARLFNLAKHWFNEQDYWRAVELCRQSIELDDDNHPERYHILGRALSQNPRWRKDAERNFKIAHKLEPWEPRYLVSLGQLYQREGLHERAERVFAQVRTIDPDFPIPKPAKDGKNAKSRKGFKAG